MTTPQEPAAQGAPVRRFKNPDYKSQAATLVELRDKIDAIDDEIVALMSRRALSFVLSQSFRRTGRVTASTALARLESVNPPRRVALPLIGVRQTSPFRAGSRARTPQGSSLVVSAASAAVRCTGVRRQWVHRRNCPRSSWATIVHLPRASFEYWGSFLANHATGHALQALHQGRHSDPGRVVHQQMHTVVLAVELDQLCLEVDTDIGEDAAQLVQDRLGEHLAPVFGRQDQVNVHQKYAVSAVANIFLVAHNAKYNFVYATVAGLQVRTHAQW
jgi:hypothetical protein